MNDDRIKELLNQGSKIKAIKEVMDESGLGLSEAKEYVETFEDKDTKGHYEVENDYKNSTVSDEDCSSPSNEENTLEHSNILTIETLRCPDCNKTSHFNGINDSKKAHWSIMLGNILMFLLIGGFMYWVFDSISISGFLGLLFFGVIKFAMIVGLIIGLIRVAFMFKGTNKQERRKLAKMSISVGNHIDLLEKHDTVLPFYTRVIDIMCPNCNHTIEAVKYRKLDPADNF